MDAWGGNDAWASSTPAAPSNASTAHAAAPAKSPAWGGDDDFGGWSSAAPATSSSTAAQGKAQGGKPAGAFGGGNDDLFSNVWE
jgi:stromal membrane-associated protein